MAIGPLVIMLNLYVTSPTNLEKEHMLDISDVYVGRSITGNKSDVFSYFFSSHKYTNMEMSERGGGGQH